MQDKVNQSGVKKVDRMPRLLEPIRQQPSQAGASGGLPVTLIQVLAGPVEIFGWAGAAIYLVSYLVSVTPRAA